MDKRKIATFLAITFIFSLILNSFGTAQYAWAKINFNTILKVNGSEVDINSKVELKPGNNVVFELTYTADNIEPKPKEGDEFKFTLPKAFEGIVPAYITGHFKAMRIEKDSIGNNVVILTAGSDIDSAIGGFLSISASIGQVEVEEVRDIIMDINGTTIKINTSVTPTESVNRLIDKKINGSDNNYTINPNGIGEIIGQEVPYSIAINEKYTLMNNAVLNDIIPAGMEIVPGSVSIKKVVNGIENNVTGNFNIITGDKLTINFGTINHKHIIEYKLKVVEIKAKYTNNATLTQINSEAATDSIVAIPMADTPTGTTDIDKSIIGDTVINPNSQGSLIGKTVSYKVNINDKKTIKNNANFTDNIPNGMKLVLDSVKIFKEERGTKQNITDILATKTNKTENLLEINFGNITTKYSIEYTTEIIADKNEYTNNANIVWDGGSSKDTIIATKNKPIAGTGVIDKTVDKTTFRPDSNGDMKNNYFKYSIIINNELTQKSNLILIDAIPDGMELQLDTIKVSKDVGANQYMDVTNSLAITKVSGQLKIDFGTTSDRYKVEYTTKTTENKEIYENTANLTWDTGRTATDKATVTPSEPIGIGTNDIVKNIVSGGDKESITVSPNGSGMYTNTINYKITINDKFEDKSNTVLIDNIPVGMGLVLNSVKVEKIDKYGASENITTSLGNKITKLSTQLKIELGDINDKYIVTYQGKINEYIKAGWKNDAKLTWGTNGNAIDTTIVNPTIPKKGTGNLNKTVDSGKENLVIDPYETGTYVGRELNYSILVNNELTEKQNLTLTDEIPQGMKLVEGSIKVLRDTGNKYEDITAKGIVTITETERNLTVDFGTTDTRFKVEYKTEIISDEEAYPNTVKTFWTGGNNTDTSTTTPNKPKPGTNDKIVKTIEGNNDIVVVPDSLFIGKEYNYEILVNDKLVNKNGTVLTDTLPAGMELVPGSLKIQKNHGGNVYGDVTAQFSTNITTNSFSINFGDIKDKYKVKYKVRITSLVEEGYKNKAVLQYDTINTEEFISTLSLNFNGVKPAPTENIITKTSEQATVSKIGNTAKYTVVINANKKMLTNMSFEDIIPKGMKLINKEFKVVETTDKGIVKDITNILINSNPEKVIFNEDKLTINFGDTYSKYVIEYICEVTELNNIYENQAKLISSEIIKSYKNEVKYQVAAGGINAIKTVDKELIKESDNQELVYSIKVWSNAVYPANYLNIEDKLDERLEYIDFEAPEYMDVVFDQATNTITAINTQNIPPTDRANAIEIKIKVNASKVKAGETIQNIAKVNGIDRVAEVKKGYGFEGTKVDGEDDSKTLQGAKFKLYKVNENKLFNIIPIGEETLEFIKDIESDVNGKILGSVDEPGKYSLKEVEAPNGYKINPEEKRFEIKESNIGTTVQIGNILNYLIKSSIKVVKTDKDNKDILLSGTTFTIKELNGRILDEKTTDSSGEVIFTELNAGEYIIEETNAPAGYLNDSLPINITIENGQVKQYNAVFANQYDGQELKIKKIDKDNNNILLEGAEFKIEDSNGNIYPNIITDKDGIAKIKLQSGKYSIVEVISPEGYINSESIKEFEIKPNNTPLELEISNEKIKGSLEIVKTDSLNGNLLSNAEFTIKDKATDLVVATGETDTDGQVIFEELPYGEYTYQETVAPVGYVIDSKEYPFEIKENGKVIEVTMKNEKIKGSLEITKTDSLNGNLLSNTEFTIKDKATGLVVAIAKTDTDGQVIFEGLQYGEYTYEETIAPVGYVIDTKKYPFEIKENGKVIQVTMNNEKIKGSLEITKTDSLNGDLLSNAEFTIKDKVTGLVVAIAKTDTDGQVIFEGLQYGEYTYQETVAPVGYVIDSKEYPFEIKENGKVIQVTMKNEKIKGSLEITKTDSVNGNVLSNAEFTIKDTATGLVVASGQTDTDGQVIFEELPYGKYTYQETIAPVGYVIDTKEYPFEIKENGKVIQVTMNNEKIKGTLEITKTDSLNGNLLSNAEFTIKDKATDLIVATGKTDKDGKVIFKELTYGEYTYQETVAPEGYVIDTKEYPFEIKENGKVIQVTMNNEKIKGSLEITKTDSLNGDLLSNAEFTIKDKATGLVVATGKTDTDGQVIFNELPYGEYTYQETVAPVGYVIDSKEYPFEIKENEKAVEVIVTNMEKENTNEEDDTDKDDDIIADTDNDNAIIDDTEIEEESHSEDIPNTGDLGMKLPIAISILSALGLTINRRKVKK